MEDKGWIYLSSLVFVDKAKNLLQYAIKLGYKDIEQLLNDYDYVLKQFMQKHWYEDAIEELDKFNYALKGYRNAP